MDTPRRIAVEELVWIHTVLIGRYGGAAGIRDSGSLEAALARPYATFGGEGSFPTAAAKAASLMESVIRRHPFVDGNKRTGTAGAVYLLGRSGYRLKGVGNAELVELAVSVADHRRNLTSLIQWFDQHSVKIPEPQ